MKIIRPIPEGKEQAAERSHVLASTIVCDEVAGGQIFAGRVYDVSEGVANYLVARKGCRFVGPDGKPSDQEAKLSAAEPRAGTAEWLAEQHCQVIADVATDENPPARALPEDPAPPTSLQQGGDEPSAKPAKRK